MYMYNCIYIYIYRYLLYDLESGSVSLSSELSKGTFEVTPNLPTKIIPTKIIPTKIRWLKTSRKSPMDMRIPPFNIKIMLESNPPKSRILVRRLAVAKTSHDSGIPDPHFGTSSFGLMGTHRDLFRITERTAYRYLLIIVFSPLTPILP